MTNGIFIAGTGTDVGKTYVTALLLKQLREKGLPAGYYKAALSGADSIEQSDAGFVHRFAGLEQDPSTLLSYRYDTAVSPHLAAKLEGNPPILSRIESDFQKVCSHHHPVVVEGSGGVICPIRYDQTQKLFLTDLIRLFSLDTLLVADAGLGTINATVLSVEYLRHRNLSVRGILLNRFTGGAMQEDNVTMIEELTGVRVLAKIPPHATKLTEDFTDIFGRQSL